MTDHDIIQIQVPILYSIVITETIILLLIVLKWSVNKINNL